MSESFCIWVRSFDGHFNLGCADKTNQRGNGNFLSCPEYKAKWEFVFCPYCGGKIKLEAGND